MAKAGMRFALKHDRRCSACCKATSASVRYMTHFFIPLMLPACLKAACLKKLVLLAYGACLKAVVHPSTSAMVCGSPALKWCCLSKKFDTIALLAGTL